MKLNKKEEKRKRNVISLKSSHMLDSAHSQIQENETGVVLVSEKQN